MPPTRRLSSVAAALASLAATTLLLAACPARVDHSTAAVFETAAAVPMVGGTSPPDALAERAEALRASRSRSAEADAADAAAAREILERARARAEAVGRQPNVVQVTGDVWGALARCESGGNTRAVGGGGRYFGAFQFSLGTWHSLGLAGNPVDYSYEDQLAAAQRLVARGGWRQFPACSRRLGLR